MKSRVVVIDDEPKMAEAIASALARSGHHCTVFTNGEAALADVLARPPDVVVTDWRMEGLDGIELLRRIHIEQPSTPVILVTAYGDVPSAVAAMRAGAFDYVTKPFDNDELRSLVERALEIRRLREENRDLRREVLGSREAEVVAESDAMKRVLELVDRAAPSKAPVLILGGSGVGKEIVARRLHYGSDRWPRPFVAVNAKALSESVLESELFGHEKGAFTGAQAAHAGCFERAHGGTLFLDEIGEVSPSFQGKLLRVLQEGEVQRVGGSAPRKVDARVVAATNRDLRADVQTGRFREDLYFRLDVIRIVIPPLAERKEDVLPLARFFLHRQARASGRELRLSPEAEAHLLAHDWPGNVRELSNAIERACVLGEHEEIQPEDLLLEERRTESGAASPDGTLQEVVDRAVSERIRSALAEAHGRKAEAAARLGIERTTLFRWMKRLGLS
jgi:DNA-binding NtrC family response regulator